MRQPFLILLMSLPLVAQATPIALDGQQAKLSDHISGPCNSIHLDTEEEVVAISRLSDAHIGLEIVIAANGRVETIHAKSGPKPSMSKPSGKN